MENVLEHLKYYVQEIDLSERFTWNFDGKFLDSIPQIGPFINGNSYENGRLRESFHNWYCVLAECLRGEDACNKNDEKEVKNR